MKWTVYWWSEGSADNVKGLLIKWRACWWSERSVDEVKGLLIKWRACWWSERSCWWSEEPAVEVNGLVDEVKGLLLKWKLTQSTWLRACACVRRSDGIAVQCCCRNCKWCWISSVACMFQCWWTSSLLSLNVSRLSWVDVYNSPPFGLCLQLTANVDSITRNA